GGEDLRSTGEFIGGLAGGATAGDFFARKAMPKVVKELNNKSVKKLLNEATPSTENLKNVGRQIYDEIDNLGGFYQSETLQGLAKNIQDDMTDFGISQGGNPRAFAVM